MRIVVPVVVACLMLTACGGNGPTAPPNPSGGASVTSPPADPTPSGPSVGPTPGATPSRPGASPTRPAGPSLPKPPQASQPSDPTALTGTVTAGVEPGCLLLDGYLLVGGPREQLRAGTRVTVTGQVQADLMTTCQQGTPFRVKSVKPA